MIEKDKLFDLLVHRKNVFAKQLDNGMYIPVKEQFTKERLKEHVGGEKTYGLYVLDTDNTVKWACIDLDGDDLENLKKDAEQIYDLYPEFTRMLEFSGRRGYHVWVIFKEPVPAIFAQQLVKSRLNRIKMLKYEVFPKQTELNENRKYGNLVKIPLAIHRVSGKRSEIIRFDEGEEKVEEGW